MNKDGDVYKDNKPLKDSREFIGLESGECQLVNIDKKTMVL